MVNLTEMFKNRYGKYSLSKIIPTVWFVFLLWSLSTTFKGQEFPKSYYDLTIIFSSVYIGKSAVDKIKTPESENSK